MLTDKMLEKPYFFSSWEYCPRCSYVQHFEENKILNRTQRKLIN